MATETNQGDGSWAEDELGEVDLADKRLQMRCQKLADELGQQPGAPINQACEDWSNTKAAYRFFDNPKVSPAKILEAHRQRTLERIKLHELVLAVQDTTYLNYTDHPQTEGLGEIGNKQQKQRGIGLHSTLAVTPHGQPLGFLTQHFWMRPIGGAAHTSTANLGLPIEDKESYRWVQAFQKVIELTPKGVQVVTVCDREGDIYEMFVLAQEQEAGLLVRAKENRRLEKETQLLWSKVQTQASAGELTVDLPSNGNRPARQATVSVRFCAIRLRPPQRPSAKNLPSVSLTAVWVQEEHPPSQVQEPIEWLLLTNTSLENFAQALQVIQWYGCRWQIEVFHRILKSGCRVEECRLQTATRLQNYLALMCVVAWRLLWLTYIGRTQPLSPCTTILTTTEWQALYAHIHHTATLPQAPPTTQQVIRWIAQLGGFLGRKADAEPGTLVLWRGWQRLQDIASAWTLVFQQNSSALPSYG